MRVPEIDEIKSSENRTELEQLRLTRRNLMKTGALAATLTAGSYAPPFVQTARAAGGMSAMTMITGTPTAADPGDIVTVTGQGFGNDNGGNCLTAQDGDRLLAMVPITTTDAQITAVFGPNAAPVDAPIQIEVGEGQETTPPGQTTPTIAWRCIPANFPVFAPSNTNFGTAPVTAVLGGIVVDEVVADFASVVWAAEQMYRIHIRAHGTNGALEDRCCDFWGRLNGTYTLPVGVTDPRDVALTVCGIINGAAQANAFCPDLSCTVDMAPSAVMRISIIAGTVNRATFAVELVP